MRRQELIEPLSFCFFSIFNHKVLQIVPHYQLTNHMMTILTGMGEGYLWDTVELA